MKKSYRSQVFSPNWWMHRDFTREQLLHARPYGALVPDAAEATGSMVKPGGSREQEFGVK